MKNVIVIDVHERGYLVDELLLSTGVSAASSTALMLPPDPFTRRRSGFLKKLPQMGPSVKDKVIIVGHASDPFADAENCFTRSLALLNDLVHTGAGAQLICVQTRSPYILLALPVLRALGAKVIVTIALEGMEPVLSRKTSAGCPDPAERVRTARALKKLGIATVVQWAPLIAEGQSQQRDLETAARTILSAAHAVRVVSHDVLLAAQRPERRLYSAGLMADADIKAAEFLRTHAPDAFLGSTAPGRPQAAAA